MTIIMPYLRRRRSKESIRETEETIYLTGGPVRSICHKARVNLKKLDKDGIATFICKKCKRICRVFELGISLKEARRLKS